MRNNLKLAYDNEIKLGKEFYYENHYEQALYHFERAHIIGQKYIYQHTLSHFWMLIIAVKVRDFKEIFGQLFRIPAGVVGSAINKYPVGNTGRSNVSAFRSMDIPDDLKNLF